MAKIPFDIKYRPQIESGEYKVETRDGRPVRIACWDRQHKEFPLIALISRAGGEDCDVYTINGKFYYNQETSAHDLFIITPEPEVELSEFEMCVKECLEYDPEVVSDGDLLEATKEYAKELLATARKELQPEIDAEVEKAYKNADRMQYEKGREDALKVLPEWKRAEQEMHTLTNMLIHSVDRTWIGNYVQQGLLYIPIDELIIKLKISGED